MQKITLIFLRSWQFRIVALILIAIVLVIVLKGIKNRDENADISQGILIDNYDYTEIVVSQDDRIIDHGESRIARKVRLLTGCRDKDFAPKILQHANYTVLRNYIRAEYGDIGCGGSVTYVSHGDFTFLNNLIPVLERWKGTLSIALMSCGSDFQLTLESIFYLRNCEPKSNLVRQFATFHKLFMSGHSPDHVPNFSEILKTKVICDRAPPYTRMAQKDLYKAKNKLSHPINVARNIAREAALTHYVFVSDIELYPSPDVPRKFLQMVAQNDANFRRPSLKVYPLPIFEIKDKFKVPMTKKELQSSYKTKDSIIFHASFCENCHRVPKFDEWIKTDEKDSIQVFTIAKRTVKFGHWEPIFIGTNNDPIYDERLTYDGAYDKLPQAFAMCALNYEFHVLDNAFLVHRPGIKHYSNIKYREAAKNRTKQILNEIIKPELEALYGNHTNCRF